jgi:magnesium chelatase family protein
MLIKVHSVTNNGTKPVPVDVEVTSTSGIPQIIIIGLVNTAVREAKDRIVTALKSLGIRIKARRTIVSLVPSDVKKSGSSFDFAIAVGLLYLYRPIELPLEGSAFIGEVSLDGSIAAVQNCFNKVLSAKKLGFKRAFIPHANLKDIQLIDDITVFGVKKLSDVISYAGDTSCFDQPANIQSINNDLPDITIVGQHQAVRAISIAVAGRHHLHLVGPPGVGKSTLPQLARILMPKLSREVAIQNLAISSIHQKEATNTDVYQAPFRSPHYSSTNKILFGNSHLEYGELSRAYHGILFLDELPLFNKQVLNSLNRYLDLSKNNKLQLIAASNPCPCGYWQTGVRTCKCTAAERNSYFRKLSGPLLDRIDLHVTILPLHSDEYGTSEPHDIQKLKEKVLFARKIQAKRYSDSNITNADLSLKSIEQYSKVEKAATVFLEKASASLHLSTRAYEKILAVSQTIADLEQATQITQYHCAEALQYRFEHSWSTNALY